MTSDQIPGGARNEFEGLTFKGRKSRETRQGLSLTHLRGAILYGGFRNMYKAAMGKTDFAKNGRTRKEARAKKSDCPTGQGQELGLGEGERDAREYKKNRRMS